MGLNRMTLIQMALIRMTLSQMIWSLESSCSTHANR